MAKYDYEGALDLLAKKGYINSMEFVSATADQVPGEVAAAILLKLDKTSDLKAAVNDLVSKGVILGLEYWYNNARPRKTISAMNMKDMIINAANKLEL